MKAKPANDKAIERRVWTWDAVALAAGAALWTWMCLHRGGGWVSLHDGGWSRGFLLLLAAGAVLHGAGVKGQASRLFPLLWLASSAGLWNLCGPGNVPTWGWAMMALASLAAASAVRNARFQLALQAPLWTGMTAVMTSSLLMPLAFAAPIGKDRKGGNLLRWAGPVAALALFAVFRAWSGHGFLLNGWLDAYELPAARKYFAFMVLSLLALWEGGRRLLARQAVVQVFLAWAGWALWAPHMGRGDPYDAVGVTFILSAGLGLETLKDELLDDSWHGRLVWASLGIMLLLALFTGT